jgi:hypothetical protein
MKWTTCIQKEVREGDVAPRGYGMAWYDPHRRVEVFYPAPIHRFARATRELLYRVQLALQAPTIEKLQIHEQQRLQRERARIAQEYASGFLTGWRECFDMCMNAIEEEMAAPDATWDIDDWFSDSAGLPSGPEN